MIQIQAAASLRAIDAMDNQGQVWSNLARWNEGKKMEEKDRRRNSEIFKRNCKKKIRTVPLEGG
jgi:hypothetical protein